MDNETQKSINTQLHRKIKSGSKYDSLIPFSDCSSIKRIGEGDTGFVIKNMSVWSRTYQHHTRKLAESEFTQRNLKDTCSEIHSFLYNHIQYKIDGVDQRLCSPACTWFKRADGVDCKSFSLFASTILLNKGIPHFFRRVKTAPNEGYSHVYVIVAKDQNSPKKLEDGYFTVDGTLSSIEEPNFYESDDLFMDVKETKSPIYGLAGVSEAKLPVYGLAGIGDSISNGVSQLVNLAFEGLFMELVGCTSSDIKYDKSVVKLKIERDLQAVLQQKINDLNDAITWNNRSRVQYLFNDLFKEIDLGIAHLRSEVAYSSGDQCEIETLTIALKYVEQINIVFNKFFENFIASFSSYKVDEFSASATTTERTLYFVVEIADNPITANYRYIVLREVESEYGIEPILPFSTNTDAWLIANMSFLKKIYTDGREIDYESEITPLISEVTALRNKVHVGGEALYYLEKPLQEKMYKIWLNYDDNYTIYLEEQTQNLKIANELAFKDFEERLQNEIEKDIEAKNNQEFKQLAGFGAFGVAMLLIIKNNSL